MSFVALAIGGGTAMSAGGSIFSGLMGSSAAKKQAAAIRQAGDVGANSILQAVTDANAKAGQMNDVARGDLSPFRDMGVRAGTSLTDLLMGGGNVGSMLKASPLFNFQSQMGTQAINRQLAARGLYGSGAGLQTLSQFNDQLVGEEGQRLVDRLFNMTQLGQNSATNMASMTSSMGQFMGGNIFNGGLNAANMRYNGTVGQANALANSQQMLGKMGQSLFDTAAGGLSQFGNFQMMQPILNGLMSGNGNSAGSQKTRGPEDILFNYGDTTGSSGAFPFSMTGG